MIREILHKFHEWKVESNCAVLARSSLPEEVRNVYDKFIREDIDAGKPGVRETTNFVNSIVLR